VPGDIPIPMSAGDKIGQIWADFVICDTPGRHVQQAHDQGIS
jgi:hypothetical protein